MTPAPPPLPPPPSISVSPAGPALWNPVAVVAWSVLFSPLFGAILVAKNWRVLGQPGRAATQRWWILGSVALVIGLLALHFTASSEGWDILLRFAALALLVAWILAGAWPQVAWVREHRPAGHARRWWLPLLLGVAGVLGFLALDAMAEAAAGRRDTAENAIAAVLEPMTTELRRMPGQAEAEVEDFRLERQRDGSYLGPLVMKSGSDERRYRVRVRDDGAGYQWSAVPE